MLSYIKYPFIITVAVAFTMSGLAAQNEAFHGGEADGYAAAENLTTMNLLSFGDSGDGYSESKLLNLFSLVSRGDSGDGYTNSSLENHQSIVSFGNGGDGYTFDSFIKIYWTGNIGTAWLNPNNWSSLTVPINSDEIIIPAGRPFYPLLGNQKLSIGNSSILSGFRCAEIWVQEGASFSGKLGTTLSNQSLLLIDGTFIWKNPSMNSFLNHSDGKVEIRTGGILMTDL